MAFAREPKPHGRAGDAIPSTDVDIYCDDQIFEPYATYAALRDAGPVVHMRAHNLYAISRFADIRKAGLNHRTFVSGHGVAANDLVNNLRSSGDTRTTIASDAPAHTKLREIIAAPLAPAAVAHLAETIQSAADDLLDRLVEQQSFDGATDFARHLPLLIVSRLVGMPEEGRQNMLEWAAATFNVLGPMNVRAQLALPKFREMLAYLAEQATPDRVTPGSWAARIYEAVDAGIIGRAQAITMMVDYLGPSLDTTIFASGHLLMLLGRHPDQWAMLRADPTLIPGAVEECVRLESPIRGFTRFAITDCEVDGVSLAAGSRVLLLYASGNRDERKWDQPERFDVRRNATGHLGFGVGRHSCAGMHLARLEMVSLLRAMIVRVARFEVGEPVRAVNNLLRGLDSLPVKITA